VSQLPVDVRGALRLFAFYLGNGTLEIDLLDDLGDYRPALMEFGSTLEMIFAIYSNVLDIAPDGTVTNMGKASYRAAQYIRKHLNASYVVEPPFEPWETELH
jgi:hypothetical protein